MATEVVERIVDDLDRTTEAVDTIEFDERVIDLNARNAKKLRTILAEWSRKREILESERAEALADYIEASRPLVPVAQKVKRRGARHFVTTTHGRRNPQADAIRRWAAGKGYEVAPRGRIRKEIVDEYEATAGKS